MLLRNWTTPSADSSDCAAKAKLAKLQGAKEGRKGARHGEAGFSGCVDAAMCPQHLQQQGYRHRGAENGERTLSMQPQRPGHRLRSVPPATSSL
jgi:hypothetical protein